MVASTNVDLADEPLRAPGHSAGLLELFRWRFLLKLLVKKELRVRYRGSVLGMLWSYVKPAVQLIVYYIAMGQFLGLGRSIPSYVVYLFSGMVMINFFNEILSNTTRSIIFNAPLVGKIFLPRELFPVSSVWVAFVHVVPQIVVLVVGALLMGWRPGLVNLLAGVLALVVICMFALGIGLAFAAFDVYFRDAENIIELLMMVAIWLSPVFYQWTMVSNAFPTWLFTLYQLNPLALGVELSHYAFWVPTNGVIPDGGAAADLMPPHWVIMSGVGVLVALLVLVCGQVIFHRLEGKFAQEL
ncbi:ABC transporter permease [Brooklawnia cerclae]|uniref:ABC transporter permease n=1 Tax=Brooklawnia cerclae TaxID=349934 RepID=UPI00141E0FE3|nr:ABC transporter permease [Brooklawnia cerclae]